ncbi:hypothetical protein IQ06DRAFT_50283 [Phaeosphaeriaceae sp. SRC1lsM3a]|nr:hypothetical protein IQ06DRAFT_50283 [Stagonospora sp. SRC1lsM3a]
MLRRIFNVNPTLPIRCSRGITKRLVLGLSTRARHVAGDVPLPCPAQWFTKFLGYRWLTTCRSAGPIRVVIGNRRIETCVQARAGRVRQQYSMLEPCGPYCQIPSVCNSSTSWCKLTMEPANARGRDSSRYHESMQACLLEVASTLARRVWPSPQASGISKSSCDHNYYLSRCLAPSVSG